MLPYAPKSLVDRKWEVLSIIPVKFYQVCVSFLLKVLFCKGLPPERALLF